ncbi:MAG: ABC transporter substrate-binding protein [Geminicoccaceae bacterium]
MRRRKLLLLLGGTVALRWPEAAAQQGVPVVGFLFMGDPERSVYWLKVWREGMAEAGFVEGQNLSAEYLWAKGDVTRLPDFAAYLVARRVAVIVTTTEAGAVAARRVTATIPIVFNYVPDPVGKRVVKSLAKPGGNITGIASPDAGALESKKLQLLREVVPAVSRIGYLVAKQDVESRRGGIDAVAAAGRTFGVEVVLLAVGNLEEIDAAFAGARQRGIGAVLVQGPSTFLFAHSKHVLAAAARSAMPVASSLPGFAEDGGVMSYGFVESEVPYLTAKYVARILNGESPAGLPVQLPTKTSLILNLRAARMLGLAFPPNLLTSADQVIE